MLFKTSAYAKSFDGQTKWMYFLIEDDELLEKYNTIWDKEFDSEPVCNKNYLKTKIKSHGNEGTDFYDKKIPKLDPNHACLAVISLDSALKKDDNYYPISSKSGPQTLLTIDPQTLLKIDPQTLLKIGPQTLLKIDLQTLFKKCKILTCS